MHFFTKAARCSMGTFSRIALSSHARIFLESARDSIRSGAVDFMLVACAGGASQTMHSARPTITINVRRMAAPDR
jgi:DMSO reductase anchor subunit